MGSLVVDPSQVQSITVDPTQVSAYAPPSTAQALTSVGSGFLNSIGHQAKGMFDTLSSLVDPHMGQKIGDAAIDAQVDQWHKAKDEYAKGNYGNALRHGLASATPLIGPLIENTADKLATGDPQQIGEGVGDITAPILLLKAAEAAPEVAAAVRTHIGETVSAAKAAAGKAAGFIADLKASADVVGLASPRAAHALRIVDKVRQAMTPAEAAAAPVDPLLDQISQQFYGAKFQSLDPKQASAVQAVADSANGKKAPPAPPSAPARAPAAAGPAIATAPPPADPEILDNAAFLRAADARRTTAAAPPPVAPAPELARAAAPTTSRPNTLLNDVDAYLARQRAALAAANPQPPPPGEPGEAAAPAPTPPPPAAPAAPAAAPPPAYGKQYITPGQVTKYAADNGLGEDDAAAALQKEGVSVVDRSSTNRVLHAIGSELGYDHGTLSEIAHATYGKGLGKITHEQMMELAEKLGNEQASKEPLAAKRIGSPADPAIAPEAEGSPLGGVVAQLPTGEIHADPVRFQYKAGMGQGGAGEELRGVTTFDPEKSGILSVWKDPADGKTYVVNGHHRLELAQRTGAQSLTVRYIDAANAAEARAKGAMINIAEGRGTSIDAAKVFRDSGATDEDLQKQGLSLTGSVAKEGQALANLDPNLFNQVVSGEMKPARGAMIGQVAEHADQQQLVKLIKEREASGRPMTDGQVSELLRMQAPQITETQHSLFGDDEISRSLIAEKAGVSDYVQSRLTQKRRTFNAVGNERAATRLAEAGNVIDADRNAQIAEATNQEHAVYQKLSTSTGPVADALDEAAKALHSGENPAIVKVKTYAKIEPILKAEADKLTGRSSASAERSEGSAQAGSGQAGRGKHNSPSAAQSAGKPAAVAEAADEDLEAPLRESLKKARVKKAAKISDLMGK